MLRKIYIDLRHGNGYWIIFNTEVKNMSEQILKINKVDICTESFGNPEDPAVLLIMGAMSSLDWWDEDFCLSLDDSGRFVIRYDHRDLGRSVSYEPGTSNYTITD